MRANLSRNSKKDIVDGAEWIKVKMELEREPIVILYRTLWPK